MFIVITIGADYRYDTFLQIKILKALSRARTSDLTFSSLALYHSTATAHWNIKFLIGYISYYLISFTVPFRI